MSGQTRLVPGLTLAVLVAALAATWLLRTGGASEVDVTSAASADATAASAEVRSDVRDAAAEAATRAYSYDWRTLAADKDAARDLMTDAMQQRYDRTMAGVATTSQRDHTVVAAEVVDTAVVTASSRAARVLVFVNQSTTSNDLAEPRLDLDRVLVTLDLADGAWKVTELDAL